MNPAIKASGMSNQEASAFFGWGQRNTITKTVTEFTKQSLEAAGWTKPRLEALAKAYEEVARLNHANQAAPARAQRIRELLGLF